jgi:hypothetical protein
LLLLSDSLRRSRWGRCFRRLADMKKGHSASPAMRFLTGPANCRGLMPVNQQ